MGLDMYLYAEKYTGKHINKDLNSQLRGCLPEIPDCDSVIVKAEVGYWRKANHIHKWFVDKTGCSNGEDAYIPRELLNDLLDLCRQVKAIAIMVDGKVRNGECCGPDTGGEWKTVWCDGQVCSNPEDVAALLPREEGLFFGGKDIDSWYMDDIDQTIKILTGALKMDKSWSFTYCPDW